ncbi:MAG: DUF6298 domain-containing protein [Bacteroidota bacterium]
MKPKTFRNIFFVFFIASITILLTAFNLNQNPVESGKLNNAGDILPISPFQENPFYFSWKGEPVFLLGAANFHSWTPISRPDNVDIKKQMDRLAGVIDEVNSPHVLGFVRCLPYDPANHMHDGNVPTVLQPWHKTEDGRYDLTRFNPSWEKRLHQYLEVALERNIIVSLEVWDDWSVTRGPGGQYDPGPDGAWNAHPFNPNNNVNYNESVLPDTTSACGAPFYSTIPSDENDQTVLKLQQNYVDQLMSIAEDYPNVIINISNESRANLKWSQYWATYIRKKLPEEYMIGDMPSTNRKDGGGQCQNKFSPLTLSLDPKYDYVDISQGVSGHEFNTITGQVIKGAQRIRSYRQSMQSKGQKKPLVVSKDYTRDEQGGRMVLWSRFTGGAASARFHRPSGDHDMDVVNFQHNAIENLGKFIATLPFWNMTPTAKKVQSLPEKARANVLAQEEGHIVVQVINGKKGDQISLDMAPGKWNVEWIHPKDYAISTKRTVEVSKESTIMKIPEDEEHQILHLYPVNR